MGNCGRTLSTPSGRTVSTGTGDKRNISSATRAHNEFLEATSSAGAGHDESDMMLLDTLGKTIPYLTVFD